MTTASNSDTRPHIHAETAPTRIASAGDTDDTDPIAVELIRTADGTTLPVARRGTARTGRPTIVLLHGITDSWRSFEEVIALLPRDVHVVAPTLRGHGDADRPVGGYTPDDFAADVIDVVTHVGARRILVVGHSLGAVVACRLAAARPDLTAGLVLAGGFAEPGRNVAVRELVDFAADLCDPIDRDTVAQFQYGTIVQPVAAERMDTFIDESLRVPARIWQAAAEGLAGADVLDGLHGSKIPTLLAWGTEDPFAPSSEQARLAQVLGNATLRPYPETGHAVHWEQPARFAEDLTAWWSTCST